MEASVLIHNMYNALQSPRLKGKAPKKLKGVSHGQKHPSGLGVGAVVEPVGLRVHRDAFPFHYTLCLKPDLVKSTFEGCVAIQFFILKESQHVHLNAADLNISKIVWEEEGTENSQEPMGASLDPGSQVLQIKFEPPLPRSKGNLRINFNGILNDSLYGFYRSESGYQEGSYNAITYFEPTGARYCFPCIDDPLYKATFDITLIVPNGKTALSNMPIKYTHPHRTRPEFHVLEFERTPRMSTYLLAILIGDFEYLESVSSSGVMCRIYTPPGKSREVELALEACKKFLTFFEDEFGIPYPIKKMDFVGVMDFEPAGMENWGLVTMDDEYLLADKDSPVESRYETIQCICHELVHQWFGNLVTMDWWSQLWLKEGCSTFFEYYGVSKLYPEFRTWEDFVVETFRFALLNDALKSSHPIEVFVRDPSEIEEIFDDISYNKGAAVIRMLYHFIGPKTFRAGIQLYLSRFQYRNAKSEDFWKAFEDVYGKPLLAPMMTWTTQAGFPLVRVTTVTHDRRTRYITLTQERFWADPSMRIGLENKGLNKSFLWSIPLTFSVATNPKMIYKTVVMDKRVLNVSISNLEADQWVKINPGLTGFYRVLYPTEMLSQLSRSIRNGSLPPLDRVGLLSDLYATAQAGLNSCTEVLSMLECFLDDEVYCVWEEIDHAVKGLDLLLSEDPETRNQFRAFARTLYRNISQKYGWPDENKVEDSQITKFRILILKRLTYLRDPETLETASEKFKGILNGQALKSPEFSQMVYQSALVDGNIDNLKALIKMYKEKESHKEKDRIVCSFAGIPENEDAVTLVLEFLISGEPCRDDIVGAFEALAQNKFSRDMAWTFFKEKWTYFKNRFQDHELRVPLIEVVAGFFVTDEKKVEVQEFFRDHKLPGTERVLLNVLDKIRVKDDWIQRDMSYIQDYVKSTKSS